MKLKVIEGKAYYGAITKQLLHKISPNAILILEHQDIDIVAAEDIVRKKVKAIINTKTSITGKMPRSGLVHLAKHNIPVFDLVSLPQKELQNTLAVKISNNDLYVFQKGKWCYSGELKSYDNKSIQEKKEEGLNHFDSLYDQFVKNSLEFGAKEITPFLKAVKELPILDDIHGKFVFIVARGAELDRDIIAVKPYIKKYPSKIIAVDGASVLLHENHITPDYIIGDMDSIPIDVYNYSSQFIAHSYMDGSSPGQKRLEELSVESRAIPFPGLSEDLAIMLAYVSGAEHIFTIGCRNSVVELVEKGRKGMGSTLLTRMYSGEKISDLKKINRWLYSEDSSSVSFTNRFLRDTYQLTKELKNNENRRDYPSLQ